MIVRIKIHECSIVQFQQSFYSDQTFSEPLGEKRCNRRDAKISVAKKIIKKNTKTATKGKYPQKSDSEIDFIPPVYSEMEIKKKKIRHKIVSHCASEQTYP